MRFLFFLIILLVPLQSSSQKKTSETDLQFLFNLLATDQSAIVDSVCFTGCDFGKAKGGFIMQRGRGSGWTTGQRVTLHKVKPALAAKVWNTMKHFSGTLHVFYGDKTWGILMIEEAKHVYVFDYAKDSTLYFLAAKVENEVCVPQTWCTANYVDATMEEGLNPFKNCTEAELRQLGLARLWAGVKQNFVFYDRISLNWDSLYAATIPQIAAAKDRTECYEVLQRMAAQVHDGHTIVYCSNYEHYNVPLRTKFIDGHVYVDAVDYSEFSKQGLRRGDELISVNGIPVIEYGEQKVMPLVSSSTTQWTLHQTFDGTSLLGGRKGEMFRLTFLSKDDTLNINYVLGSGEWDSYEDEPLMTYRRLKGNVGYLRIRNFYGDCFDAEFEKNFKEISKTDALIIDVRNNSGGNTDFAEHVLRRLSADSIRLDGWTSPCYIPAYASWGWQMPIHSVPPQVMKTPPMADTYTRPIAVLVDGGTFSAAENFCAAYLCMKRGHLIGTPTGGSTGNGVLVELIPNHSYANICSKHDTAPDGTEYVGIGVQPDVFVEETYDSYFNSKLDATTTKALELLK